MKQRVLPNVHKALSPFVSDYEPIVRLLQQVKGPANVQKYVIQHAIKEAVRYETMTRFSILNSQWNGHKVHKELNFDFYPLSSISISDLFVTSLIVFFFCLSGRFKKHVLIQQLQTTFAELEKKDSAHPQPTSNQDS